MKKIILTLITLILFTFIVKAQINTHAIGLRFGGGNFGNGAEITYQYGFTDTNRIELDLGWYSNNHYYRSGVTGIYHWVWKIENGFNWFAGPGVQFWTYAYRDYYVNEDKRYVTENGGGVAIGGQVGIEYDFNHKDTPLLISLDARPMFNFISYHSGFGYGMSFSVRYTF